MDYRYDHLMFNRRWPNDKYRRYVWKFCFPNRPGRQVISLADNSTLVDDILEQMTCLLANPLHGLRSVAQVRKSA